MQLNGIGSMFREHNNESRINYLHATQMEWGTAFCRTLMYIPVVLVLGIIAMAWYSYVFVLHDLSFLPGILFSIPIALITISYIRCVLTDNSVPLSQPPPGATLCYKCDRVRPERTHHCSLCGTCQLKMDHHCPWLGNCVGFRNHKYFILFLSYGALTAFIYCATSVGSLSDALFSKGHERSFIVLFTSIIVFAFGITLFPFSGFHIYLVLINSTTLEFGYIRGDNPYDMGRRKNWEHVFGTNPLLWFLPVATEIGDGFNFNQSREEDIPLNQRSSSSQAVIPGDDNV